MKIHFPKPKHLEQMKELWSICFNDSKDYIDFYYKNCYKPKNTLIAEEDGKVVSMMTFLPALLHTNSHMYKGVYVYAVATHPDYRNRGYVEKLDLALGAVLEYRGDKFMALVPSNAKLFDMYAKFGYTTSMYLGETEYNLTDFAEKSVITNISAISDRVFVTTRQHYVSNIGNTVYFDGYIQDYWYKELCKVGCKAINVQNRFGQGYIVYYYNEDKTAVHIREVGMSRECFEAAFSRICDYLKVDTLQIRGNIKFSDNMQVKPYGMIKFLDESLNADMGNIYMNLMLD